MANELEKLELLSLVNSVTQELVNYSGLSGAPRANPRSSTPGD
jgi:hypothetical protein